METDNISKHSGLMSAIRHYSNPQTCIDEVASVKWPNGSRVPALLQQEGHVPFDAADVEVPGLQEAILG